MSCAWLVTEICHILFILFAKRLFLHVIVDFEFVKVIQ